MDLKYMIDCYEFDNLTMKEQIKYKFCLECEMFYNFEIKNECGNGCSNDRN